jgi:nucleotide-binding universal stress UspA family protein
MLDTIAVGTDGTATAAKALDVAIGLAGSCGARLVVIGAYKPKSGTEAHDVPAEHQWTLTAVAEVDEILTKAARRAQKQGLEVTTVASDGGAADVLCRCAEDQGADLLVVGNKGMNRRILGSVPNSVAHKARCSVLIVKTT